MVLEKEKTANIHIRCSMCEQGLHSTLIRVSLVFLFFDFTHFDLFYTHPIVEKDTPIHMLIPFNRRGSFY